MRVYLAGPMTGLPEWNFPAFTIEAYRWRSAGHIVDNPAEHFGGDTTRPYNDYIRVSLIDIFGADLVVMLPGWQQSRGACLEHHTASVLDIPIAESGWFSW